MPSKATIKKMKTMFNGSLPIIKANVIIEYDGSNCTYIYDTIEVEVLTINLASGSLRVRYIANIWGELEIRCEDIYDSEYIEKILKLLK